MESFGNLCRRCALLNDKNLKQLAAKTMSIKPKTMTMTKTNTKTMTNTKIKTNTKIT